MCVRSAYSVASSKDSNNFRMGGDGEVDGWRNTLLNCYGGFLNVVDV